MKKGQVLISALALSLALPLLNAPVQAASTPVAIHINGSVLNTDQSAFNDNGTVFVPVRHIIEALGGNINWDDAKQTAVAAINGQELSFTIGSNSMHIGHEAHNMNGKVRLVGDRTMVPVRFVGEFLGGEVQWDQAKQVVIVDTRSRPLFDAIRDGDVSQVRQLLASGINPNVQQQQKTPLFLAIEEGELEIARVLLAQPGIDPYGSPIAHTVLQQAVVYSDVAAINVLLQGVKNPTFDQKAAQESALYSAVVRNRNEAAFALLKNGVNPNIPNLIELFQKTPEYAPQNDLLVHATLQNNPELITALLEAKASPNVHFDGDLASALHHAAIANYNEVIAILLKHQADPNIAPHSGWTPLMVAAERGHTAAVKGLLEGGAPVNTKNNFGATAYIIAKTHGNEETMKLLAAAGADTAYSPKLTEDAVHFRKHTPRFEETDTELMKNAFFGQTGNVKALLENGADPNVFGIIGSAITYASGYTETIKALLTAPSFQDTQGKNRALNAAIETRNVELATLLLKAGAKSDYTTYNLAVNTGPGLLDTLFKYGIDPNEPLHDTKNYGLALASMWGQSDLVRVFLNNGANPDLADDEGQTPLLLATLRGDTATMTLLLNKSASVNHTDTTGRTALYIAVNRSDLDSVKLLLGAKAQVTPEIRELAAKKANQAIIELLN